jgi:hypothetical protein
MLRVAISSRNDLKCGLGRVAVRRDCAPLAAATCMADAVLGARASPCVMTHFDLERAQTRKYSSCQTLIHHTRVMASRVCSPAQPRPLVTARPGPGVTVPPCSDGQCLAAVLVRKPGWQAKANTEGLGRAGPAWATPRVLPRPPAGDRDDQQYVSRFYGQGAQPTARVAASSPILPLPDSELASRLTMTVLLDSSVDN